MPNTYCREHKNTDSTEYRWSICYKDCFTRILYNSCGCINYTYKSKWLYILTIDPEDS